MNNITVDMEWASLYLPGFSGGYNIVTAPSLYGVFRIMQWFSVTELSAGIDVVLGLHCLHELNCYISQHEKDLDQLVCTIMFLNWLFLSMFLDHA